MSPSSLIPLLLLGCLATSMCGSARSQPIFSIDDLPHTVGNFTRGYVSTNEPDVSEWIRAKGGPQRWDFSAPQGNRETIERTDIVAADDGGHGGDFPEATYAERITHEANSTQAWSYFQLDEQQGRLQYGFYDPVGNPADPVTAFERSIFDLPPTVQFDQSWEQSTSFQDVVEALGIPLTVLVRLTTVAKADAYGTVILPELGEMPALRVNELTRYDLQETTLGLPLDSQYFRNYYWLVKGIGKAVHIVSAGQDTPVPEDFTAAKFLLRVFEANTDQLSAPETVPVKNLRAMLKGDELFLSWDPEPGAAKYQVRGAPELTQPSAWQTLGQTNDGFFFVPISRESRGNYFYVEVID